MNIAAIELWALRALAILAALIGFAFYWGQHGASRTQAKWDAQEQQRKIAEGIQNAQNKVETQNRQNAVDVAEAQAASAQRDLDVYRRAHPLRVPDGLCPETTADIPAACAGAGDGKAVASCKTGKLLQQKAALDNLERKLSALDNLMAEADVENDNYAVCLSTRPAK